MDWLNRIFGSGAAGRGQAGVLWLYARCSRCGTPVAVRVNAFNELSEADEGGYVLRKEMMDSKCFQLMKAEVHFDGQRRIKEQTIEGGTFLTREEYESLRAKQSAG